MTTTYEPDLSTGTIAAPAAGEPDAYTIAQAWMSSPLGEVDGEIGDGFAATEVIQQPRPQRRPSRAPLFAVLAAGVIGGAALGAVLFGSIEPGKPTVVVPGSGVSTSPFPASAATPSSPSPAPKPGVAIQAPTPVAIAPSPKPVASVPELTQPSPGAADDPGTPPVSPPPVIVDIHIPPLPAPDPAPEPPAPEPPKFNPDPPKQIWVEKLAPITTPGLQKLQPEKSIQLNLDN
jgi:hypothetical protein